MTVCITSKRQKYSIKSFNINIGTYTNSNYKLYRIYKGKEHIGSIELIDNTRSTKRTDTDEKENTTPHIYIENIFIEEQYRNRGCLRRIINHIQKEYCGYMILCLPLPQHVEKFKHLGFKLEYMNDTDEYYSLTFPIETKDI